MRTINYRQAINEAIVQEMRRDSSVFIYGIDVSDHKRTFGTSSGLVEEFGQDRCFSTPLSEDAMTGFGLGAAINGMRPIHVHMRVDFLLLCVNQLFNLVSSFYYGSAGKLAVPIVIRAVIGRGWGQSYQHSKSLQSVFAHVPGLKVVMPSSPADVKGMLVSAIRDDNPVIVIEHRWLYDVEGHVDEEPYETPLDEYRVVQHGKDITIVATSWMNIEAHKAAEILAKYHGVEAEIIDARCIHAISNDTILSKSVNKTGLCIIADYDWVYSGFSGELAAQINNKCFGNLTKPIRRIGFEHTPCPCTRPLEDEFYANAIDIIRNAESLLDLPPSDLSTEYFYSYENKFKGPF